MQDGNGGLRRPGNEGVELLTYALLPTKHLDNGAEKWELCLNNFDAGEVFRVVGSHIRSRRREFFPELPGGLNPATDDDPVTEEGEAGIGTA